MSSRKPKPRKPPPEAVEEAHTEPHLLDLRRFALGLESNLRQLPFSLYSVNEYSPLSHCPAVMILALINLAARGLAPATLPPGGARLLQSLYDSFFCLAPDRATGSTGLNAGAESLSSGISFSLSAPLPSPQLQVDTTAFAGHCASFLSTIGDLSGAQCVQIVELIKVQLQNCKYLEPEQFLRLMAGDSLAVGWAYENLSEKQTAESATDDWQTKLSTTQFFTPTWIGVYLCEEALPSMHANDFTLLDPACGCGHLLVQALKKAAADSAEADRQARLASLLGNNLYGLDIDNTLLTLAAFSIYLTARDLLRDDALEKKTSDRDGFRDGLIAERYLFDQYIDVDLPPPNLFCLEPPLGSLKLGHAVHMRSISGETVDKKILPSAFDAIVMNPPYLSTRTMDDTTASYLKEHYPDSAGDLYTAFMQLAMGLLKEGGRLSTIVQQSFLSITRYRNFRMNLLQNYSFISTVQLGTGAFPSRPGEKVNNAIITLQRAAPHDSNLIKYLRLQGREDHNAAMAGGLTTLAHNQIAQSQAVNLIQRIAGQPFAFHCPAELAALFTSLASLGTLKDDFVLTNGLFTCDNNRFVKLAEHMAEQNLSADELKQYVPYDKGGGQKWYHQTPYLLHWGADGQAIRDFRASRGQSRRLPGEDFYFKDGLTYSYIGTKGFNARLLSPGAIFDIASSAIFSLRHDLYYVLGFFNSALVAYLLSLLNPTINFQIGDLRKLPFKEPDIHLQNTIATLAREAVSIVRTLNDKDQLPAITQSEKQAMVKREIAIQTLIDNLIFDHYQISTSGRQAVLEEGWVRHGRRGLV